MVDIRLECDSYYLVRTEDVGNNLYFNRKNELHTKDRVKRTVVLLDFRNLRLIRFNIENTHTVKHV